MEDLSITAIHHALQAPTDLESIRTHNALFHADASTVDRVLKRLLNYLHGRNQRWPARRLFRCLDYIIQGCNPQGSTAIFQQQSFQSCIKAALDRLAHGTAVRSTTEAAITEQCQLLNNDYNNRTATDNNEVAINVQIIIKLIGDVLEHPSCHDGILSSIRQSRSMMYILQWASVSPKLESICLNALAAKGKFFAKDMIELDAFWVLASLVGRIPGQLALSRKTTNKTSSTAVSASIKVLYLCLKSSRIFENLINYAKSSQANAQCREKAIQFVHSVNFRSVTQSWGASSSHYLEDPHNATVRKLMHSLTSIVSSCVVISKVVAPQLADIRSVSIWRAILSYDMKAFSEHLIQQQREQQKNGDDLENTLTDEIVLRMQRIIRIALGVAVSHNKGGGKIYRQSSADEITQDITVFLLLFGLDVIVPEQVTAIGRPATSGLLEAYFGDCDFHHISSNKAILLKKHQDFLIVLLECYIQHLQLASEWMVVNVSGYMAHFLINVLGLLTDLTNDSIKEQAQEISPIQPRLQKLVSYFLHFDSAVQVFATAPVYLNNMIWLPTIHSAIEGLEYFNNNKSDSDDVNTRSITDSILTIDSAASQKNQTDQREDIVLYKARRAFAVLRTVTKFSNACAKLEQAGALQMVNINFIPSNVELLENSISMLNVYASFTHFIAALASRMALIRAKLRDEFSIGPVIMKLLWQASFCLHGITKEATSNTNTIQVKNAWTHLIIGCLMVINAFEFDSETLQKWLSWPLMDDTHEKNDHQKKTWIQSQMTSSVPGRLSVLPAVLQVLFPGRSRQNGTFLLEDMHSNTQMDMLLQACNAFNLLSAISECGIQLVRDTNAIQLLCELLKELLKYPKNTTDLTLHTQADDDTKMPTLSEELSRETGGEDQLDIFERENNSINLLTLQAHINNAKTTSMSGKCFDLLHRGLVRVLSSQENMRFIITSDILTSFFKPLRTSMVEMDNYKLELCRILCHDLNEERSEDFIRLFRFTSGDGSAIRLHELCAVASGYAFPSPTQWGSMLGICTGEEAGEEIEIIHTNGVFGVLCRMLMCDLLEQESDSVYEAPYRRPAAAQVIEILTQVLLPAWVADREDMIRQVQNKMIQDHQVGLEEKGNGNDMVGFTTQYSNIPIIVKRDPLVHQSNFFAALLSGEYAEGTRNTIQLLDITDHALKLFLDAVNGMSFVDDDTMIRGYLSSDMAWCDVIDILLAADRFCNAAVAMVCEGWISRNLVNKQNKERLNGAILLFRRCRDSGTLDGGLSSDVWPFQNVLKQAFMVIVSELSNSCQTAEFNKMLQENNEHELSSFCQGIVSLICSTIA